MTTAVVVTYSAPAELLDRCLLALRTGGGVDEVIVVDTGGAAHPADPTVDLVASENRGYGAAANVGIERAMGRGASAVAVLNDDVIVRPGWVEPLLSELGSGVGAAQPKLLVADTHPALINSLGVRIERDGAGVDIGDGQADIGATMSSDLEIFTGGAVVLSSEFLRATGGFDERYFLYYEDVDLALRGRALGWRYRLVPASVVEHVRGATTGADLAQTRFHQERNRLLAAFRFAPPATVARAVWLSVRRLRHQPRVVHLRALASGLAGAPGAVVRRLRGVDSVHERFSS